MAVLIDELVRLKKLPKIKANELKEKIKTSDKREEEVILANNIVPEDFLFALKSKKLNIPLERVYPEDIS